MNIQIKILGGGGEVGRTAILLKSLKSGKAILLDYGINFDEQDKPIFPHHVKPRELNAIILTHAHLDHCGALPSLYVSHKVPLYTTPLTIELSDLLIRDLIKLSGYYLPYEHVEVNKMLNSTIPITYGEEIEVDKDVKITLYNAGHVPGSSMIYIEFEGYRILFTGDFNLSDTCLLKGADLSNIPRNLDLVIMEGTYVNANHPDRNELEKQFISTVIDVLEKGGTVLIPSFTVGRAQEVLLLLTKYELSYPIIVDGLARVANEVIMRYPHYLRDFELYRKALEYAIEVPSEYFRRNIGKEPCIIISPAGMLKGGPAVQYLKKLAKNRKNAIILPSYQAPTTPGFQLLTKGKIQIEGIEIKIDAQIHWFDLSAHSGKKELTTFIKYFKETTKIIIVHTNLLNALKFVNYLHKTYGLENIYVPSVSNEEIIV